MAINQQQWEYDGYILVGGLEHEFYFPIYSDCHHPQLTWTPWFFRGVRSNHQPELTRLRVHVSEIGSDFRDLICHVMLSQAPGFKDAGPFTDLSWPVDHLEISYSKLKTAEGSCRSTPWRGDGGSGSTPRAQEVWKLRLGQLGCYPSLTFMDFKGRGDCWAT